MAHAAVVLPFSSKVFSYLLSNCTQNVFEILSRKKDGFDPRSQTTYLSEATDNVNENEEVAAELQERSAPTYAALRYMSYLYPKHVNNALTNDALFKVHTSCKKCGLYELQIPKLPRVFEV